MFMFFGGNDCFFPASYKSLIKVYKYQTYVLGICFVTFSLYLNGISFSHTFQQTPLSQLKILSSKRKKAPRWTPFSQIDMYRELGMYSYLTFAGCFFQSAYRSLATLDRAHRPSTFGITIKLLNRSERFQTRFTFREEPTTMNTTTSAA